jgi:acyl-CoA dehydrogenase
VRVFYGTYVIRSNPQMLCAEASQSSSRSSAIAVRVERFVRTEVVPYETDDRWLTHGPSDELVAELRAKACSARLLCPHILEDGSHLTHRETAAVLRAAGVSPLGPVALNVAAPDEGNIHLLEKIATLAQRKRFLEPLISGTSRSAFFMTEPAGMGGAGSDPSMLLTTAVLADSHWIINGTKAFITGALGAKIGIIVAKTQHGATLFIVELPDPAVKIERIYNTLDGTMPGGHALVRIENLAVPAEQILGRVDEGFTHAQVRLAPARLTHCMRWLGAASRAQEIAVDYACRRKSFGKVIIDHEGVGFMLADNAIELIQAALMVNWCAEVLDSGVLGTRESSMTKVAVSEAIYRIADRCVQVMGAIGVSDDTIVQRIFREARAFRVYDGPTEVHKWSIAKAIKKEKQMGLEANG